MDGVLLFPDAMRRRPPPPSVVRQKERSYPIDKAWQDALVAELDRRGRGAQEWLAKEIGCTPASITNILKPDATRSKLVPKIHKALGWVDTAQPVSAIAKTEALRKLQSNWGHLTEEQQEMIASLSEQLAAVKR